MAEGVAAGAAVVGDGVHDDPDHPPAPDPVAAPRGWTWDRPGKHWRPRQRGPVIAQQQEPTWDDHRRALAEQIGQRPGDEDQGAAPAADPEPGWQQQGGGQVVEPVRVFQLDAEARKDIKALVALCYTVPGEALPLLDPYCFGPLAEPGTANDVITAVSDIVCGSPRVARWAASASGLMPWLKLALALKPVAIAALHHHVLRDVDVEFDRDSRTMTVSKADWQQYPAA